MNLAGMLRLVWKEYRVVRGFWLSLVVLVVLLQWSVSTSSYSPTSLALLYNIGLAAPAFFAIGAAGAAFAMEREEGTFEFLRTVPITAGQLLTSKLGVAVAGTVAMFAVLATSTLLFTYPRSPAALDGMLGLWIVAVLEAIAWGTLFSQLTARPLMAIVLALVAASTIAHFLTWGTVTSAEPFGFAPYLAAAPRRALVAIAVLAVDVYLGFRWLGASDTATGRRWVVARRMLGHLFWLQWRQSAWLMLLMAGLHVTLTLLVVLNPTMPQLIAVVPLIACPALMGCFVFLADQEQDRYRFFAEHGIPPRYVWLTRQLPWLATLFLSTSIIVIELWFLVQTATVALVVMGAMVCYAAGQWVSMMVRSGVMAGVAGLVLAGLLCGWVVLMNALHVGWTWSVLPIPLVLLWATWLCAPNWVCESKHFTARAQAACAVLVPAFALLVAVPLYRVYELPLVRPGFDQAIFESTITPEAKKTAELYREANDRYVSASPSIGFYDDRVPAEAARHWLGENAKPLAMVLEASQRPTCVFDDPRTVSEPTALWNGIPLVQLVLVSGRQMEFEGKLDEALDRYFAALQIVSQLANNFPASDSRERLLGIKLVFAELVAWGAHKDQTADGIRKAVKRLQALDNDLLRLDDRLKTEYIVARRYVFGDSFAWPALFNYNSQGFTPAMRWPKLMPWEENRGLRELNLVSVRNFQTLKHMRETLAEGRGVVDDLPLLSSSYSTEYVSDKNEGWNADRNDRRPREYEWVAGLTPQLWEVKEVGTFVDLVLAELEAHRRGTLLILALEAYRLDHGKLPRSLDDLLGGSYFRGFTRRDPYSGRQFRYFADGLPNPTTGAEAAQLDQVRRIDSREQGTQPLTPGIPCVWSTGPFLHAVFYRHILQRDTNETENELDNRTYYILRQPDRRVDHQMPKYIAWGRGFWFPIPASPR